MVADGMTTGVRNGGQQCRIVGQSQVAPKPHDPRHVIGPGTSPRR
jgi:hypothetical protein